MRRTGGIKHGFKNPMYRLELDITEILTTVDLIRLVMTKNLKERSGEIGPQLN